MAFSPPDELQGAVPESQLPQGLGHADLLEPGVVGAKHDLMAQAAVDPSQGDVFGKGLGVELPGAVEVERPGVGVDVGVLHHEHGGLPDPGPAEVAQADAQTGVGRRHRLEGVGPAVLGEGVRLPGQPGVEQDRLVEPLADLVDGLQPGVAGHEVLSAGMELQPLQLQPGEGVLQPVRGHRVGRVHAGEADEPVRGQIHQAADLLVVHQGAAHGGGVVLGEQAQLIQTGAGHLVEDVLQGGGAVFVDVQLPVAQLLPRQVPIDGLKEGGVNVYVDEQGAPSPAHRPARAIMARTLSTARRA